MGTSVKLHQKSLALMIGLCLLSTSSSALAATKKPSASPTAKPSAKATAKPSAKATAKATVSTSPTVSAKPTVKPKPKPKPKKPVRKSPSPKPTWPPNEFAFESGVYAKVPTSKELIGILSARTTLASQVEACTKFVCGAVLVASEPGCRWWEVNSRVFAPDKTVIGSLQTIAGPSKPKEIKTILLISPEPLDSLEYITGIEVVCHQEEKPSGYPSVTFTKVES